MNVWTLDFETKAITNHIPPEPVGLAVRSPNGNRTYYSWGHPDSKNKYHDEDAKRLLYELYRDKEHIVFHNAKFDTGVAQYHWQLAPQDWTTVHDTMFLLFLNDPYSKNLSLKPASEELLDWPPEEQDKLHNWIIQNVPEAKPSTAGAYISLAPHELVEEYALGDVERTHALFELLYQRVGERGMMEAYHREQQLIPILYESELRGVRLDRERLGEDLYDLYEPALLRVEADIRGRLNSPELDFGKKTELADALESAGFIGDWVLTPTGRRSTSKDNLEKAINDDEILHLLRYRGAMAGVLQTFGRPWMEDSADDGRLHPQWNQVRSRGAHSDSGTRTGRLSCNRPNLMNVPNELRIAVPEGYPAPPLMRKYMLPEEGHVWCKRDFSSQELRHLAHFEEGVLLENYNIDPELDPHSTIQGLVAEVTGVEYPRKDIKISVFSIIYGAGVNSLSEQLGVSRADAKAIRDGLYAALPGLAKLQRAVSKRGDTGGYITTWGGRQYHSEPAKLVGGRIMNFSYKLLNYLIQGSASDQTKQCTIDWWRIRDVSDYLLALVHDEANISAPQGDWEYSMQKLKHAMDQDLLDCPSRSEGFVGPNWHEVTKCA